MSVIAKGMDLPLGCCYGEYEKWTEKTKYCPFCNHDDVPYCILELNHMVFEELHFIEIDSRPDWCPLTEIPKGSRLVDANEMKGTIDGGNYNAISRVKEWIDNQPTIYEEEEND